jgi:hypothetical protein
MTFELIPLSELDAPKDDFQPIPVGDYKAVLKSIGCKDEEKDDPRWGVPPHSGLPNEYNLYSIANSGKGQFMRTVWEIVEGDYKGRLLFENLNIRRYGSTPDDIKTSKIALGKFSRIWYAYTKEGFAPSKIRPTLENKPPVLITVKIQKRKGDYGPSNEITNWKSLVPQMPQQPSAPPTQPDPFTPDAQPPTQQPPWGQNNQQQGW